MACDVGQGDALLVSFGEIQVLTDAGRGTTVIKCLEKYMPVTDRTLELVVLTNPDHDHYGGLIDVFERYKVEALLANSFDKSAQEYQVLKNIVGGRDTQVLYPKEGTIIRYGEIYLDILWPTDLYYSGNFGPVNEKKTLGALPANNKPNNLSIVTHLRYKDFDALLTGDIEEETSDIIAKKITSESSDTTFEYLKVPHHGSKNGLTKNLLEAVNPEIAVISLGKDNSYGHPHTEVLRILNDKNIRILRTDEVGDVVAEVTVEGYSIKAK